MRERRIFRGAAFGGFVALVAGGASCTSLPDIQSGMCGNGVVEPDHNEDCDNTVTDDAGKALCYPAGTPGQCHFDCSSNACPLGFSCGTDDVCRKPKGVFSEVGHPTQISADRLFAGDFDQDGHADVVAETDVQMDVLYGDATGALGAPFVIRAEGNPAVGTRSLGLNPTVGALAFDPGNADSELASDLIFTKSVGITTWRGRPDRTLVPTGYSSFHIGADQAQFITARVTSLTQDVLMLLSDAVLGGAIPFHGSLAVRVVSNTVATNQFFAAIPNKLPAQIVGVPLVANLDATAQSPCDEFVLAYGGDAEVDMFRTCTSPSEANLFVGADILNPTPTGYVLPQKISFPPGTTVRTGADAIGVHAADINGDGKLDLFIDADAGAAGPTTLVTYGVGDGTFSSSPTLSVVDNAAVPVLAVDLLAKAMGGGPLLAVGQLTSRTDLIADLVFPKAVILNVPKADDADAGADGGSDAGSASGGVDQQPVFADIPWTNAVIADIDGDGALDLAAGAPNRFDFYKGTGTALYTHVPYVVNGDVGGIQIGDFDGDLANDVTFRASHANDTADMNVMWGHLFSFPDNPFFVGSFPKIMSTTSGVVATDVGNNDALTDVGILTLTPPPNPNPTNILPSFDISVLAGSPTRQLQSVFFLQEPQVNAQGLPAIPLAYAVGQLTRGDKHPDLAIAAAVQHDLADTKTFDMKIAVAQGQGAGLLVNPPLFTPVPFDTFNNFVPGKDANGKAFTVSVADWTRLSLATVDFDGDGVDEIVGIAPAVTTAGAFFWAKLDGDVWKVEAVTPRGAPSDPTQNRASIAQVVTADVNGDGATDVLLLSDTGTSSSLTAYINAQDGKFPTKSVPIALPASVSATDHIVAMAAIDADSDPGKEIALLTSSEVGGVLIAKSNAAGDAFTVTGPICSDGSDQKSCHTRVVSGNSITTADIDGDGIDDLVVEAGQTLHVYKGLAVDP